jgi:hypothetical protein
MYTILKEVMKRRWLYMFCVEIFKKIKINMCETNYVISSKGAVINDTTGKTLTPFIAGKGYYYVHLSILGKKMNRSVHRLVAKAFIDNPNNLPVVNHKFGTPVGKLINEVWNLEWVTYSRNNIHAYDNKLNTHIGIHSHFNKYPEHIIHSICKEIELGTRLRDISTQQHIAFHLVSDIYYRFRWRVFSKNYKFVNNDILYSRYTNMKDLRNNIWYYLFDNRTNEEIINILKLDNVRYIENTIDYYRKLKEGSTNIENYYQIDSD